VKTGTKSVLFGAHCFFLHPWFVAAAWTKLYGFPLDPRIWLAFFVHDIGYLGKPNMDGPEGEMHPEVGAKIMSLFGSEWRDFSLYHSRYYSKLQDHAVSRLCFADKLAFSYHPRWMYLPMTAATGELAEYMGRAKQKDKLAWHTAVSTNLTKWVEKNKDGDSVRWTGRAHAVPRP
jgi:hypothetical protein